MTIQQTQNDTHVCVNTEASTVVYYKEEVPMPHPPILEVVGLLTCVVLVFGLIIFIANVCEAIFDTRKKVNTLLSRRKK